MKIEWTRTCAFTGVTYKECAEQVHTVDLEPYPPGGNLVVMRDCNGKLIAGPMLEEIHRDSLSVS